MKRVGTGIGGRVDSTATRNDEAHAARFRCTRLAFARCIMVLPRSSTEGHSAHRNDSDTDGRCECGHHDGWWTALGCI